MSVNYPFATLAGNANTERTLTNHVFAKKSRQSLQCKSCITKTYFCKVSEKVNQHHASTIRRFAIIVNEI
eukprot:361497-Karenia_brevis.AAC.1